MNNKFQIFGQADKEAAAAEAGEHLNLLLTEHKKTPVLLLLSGGSALGILDYVGSTSMGENLTISVLDERFSEDITINNFAQMQKSDFYQLAFDAGASFFGTLPRPNESMPELKVRWELNLKNWKKENSDGLIIATLGMGADGHTAGIFPQADKEKFTNLFESDNWVTAYTAETQYAERITTTATFINKIDIGLVYVCGIDKKAKLSEVIKNQSEINTLPALLWYKIKDTRVFTDMTTS
ncbi:MAG: 6-phosphogluconolactonase [Candidatus Doudnabacteria bacterium]|jgi:6-phosphogluconolactonase/glucosamine-6-phosphate isomerase/deaminase